MSEPGRTGRPRLYDPAYLEIARERYMRGDTHAKVAKLLGVERQTIARWVAEKEEYRRAYREGRAAAPAFRLSELAAWAPRLAQARAAGASHAPGAEPVTAVERIFVRPSGAGPLEGPDPSEKES